jgi:hypothetical protein
MRDRVRELRRVRAAELMKNQKNWRRHPERQRRAMRAVLKEIGYADALLAREAEDGQLILIDGHLRVDTTPDDVVPVLVLDVTEAEGDKILATLDPLAGMAEIDDESLSKLMITLQPDTTQFGELLAELSPRGMVGLIDEDAVPEPPVGPITQNGDLWSLGAHRLLCGDSTRPEDVARLLKDRTAEILITDPPYGVNYSPDWRNKAARAGKLALANRREGKVLNDDRANWSEALRLYRGPVAYVWHATVRERSPAFPRRLLL